MLTSIARELVYLTRWHRWAGSKLPMLLCAFVLAMLSNVVSFETAVVGALQLTVHVLGYASFGYVANSFSDIQEDLHSGKGSVFSGWSAPRASWAVAIAALTALVPLLVPPIERGPALLSGIGSIVVAAAYSLRPIRLKERGILGVVSSALAQRTLPVLTILLYFGPITLPLALFALLACLVGVRFILVHQADDFTSDLITGTRTFGTKMGLHRIEELVIRVIVPLEVLAVAAWLLGARPIIGIAAEALLLYLLIHLLLLLLLARHTRFPIAGYGPLSELYSSYLPLALSLTGVVVGDRTLAPLYAGALILSLGMLPASLVEEFHRARRLARNGRGRELPIGNEQIDAAVRSGVDALVKLQRDDGSFELIKWGRDGRPEPAHHLFASAWVLIAGEGVLPQALVQRAAAVIVAARAADGTWNFDPSLGIPNDADSTSCALAALATTGASIGERERELLRLQWRPERERFATWFSGDERWRSADRDDPVVNLNILAALELDGTLDLQREAQGIARYLGVVPPTSRYYCDPMAIPYAARRAGVPLDRTRHRAWGRPGGRSTTTSIAHWLTINETPDDSLVAALLSRQQADGSWPAEPWFTGVNVPFWGSRAVTTAFCVEALHLTEMRMQRSG